MTELTVLSEAELPSLSVEPLIREFGGVRCLARWLGLEPAIVSRWRKTGITIAFADRVAISRGLHPVDLWPDWYGLPVIMADAA